MIIYKSINLNQKQKLDLKRLLLPVISHNISNLSKPCFEPSLKKVYHQMIKITNINEKDLKLFTKKLWKGRKEEKFDLHNDHIVIYYFSLMNYFLNQKTKLDYELYMYTMHMLVIKYYLSTFKKYFKNYCNESIFKQTLESISKNHLFVREKTIGNAMYFLSNTYIKKFKDDIYKFNLDNISLILQEIRHRISQSFRSFANSYYELSENPTSGFKTQEDYEDNESGELTSKNEEKRIDSINHVVKKITMYKEIDIKIQEESRKKSKLNSSIATLIVKELSDLKYTDDLKVILKLFTNDLKSVNQVCGKEFYTYLKSLMAVKKSVKLLFFKKQINLLLIKILGEIDYIKKYNDSASRNQFYYNQFLAMYICLIYKKTLCK